MNNFVVALRCYFGNQKALWTDLVSFFGAGEKALNILCSIFLVGRKSRLQKGLADLCNASTLFMRHTLQFLLQV